MEILAKADEWVPSTDAENLAKFLDTDTGKRFLVQLADGAPLLLAEGDVNAILIRSGEVRSFHSVIQLIVALAHPSAPPAASGPTSEYPAPEDDKHWNDGRVLNDPTPSFEKDFFPNPATPTT